MGYDEKPVKYKKPLPPIHTPQGPPCACPGCWLAAFGHRPERRHLL